MIGDGGVSVWRKRHSVSPMSVTPTPSLAEPSHTNRAGGSRSVWFSHSHKGTVNIVRPMVLSILHILSAGALFLPDMVPNGLWGPASLVRQHPVVEMRVERVTRTCAEGRPRLGRDSASLSSRCCRVTNTFLIGFAQIGSNSTCVQFNEVTKEQSSRHGCPAGMRAGGLRPH